MEKTVLDATERRRRIAGACLIFAPLVMLVADVMLVAFGEEAGFWPWSFGLWLSFYLFIFAVLAIARLLSRGADRLGIVGGALAIAGLLMGATMQGMFRTFVSMEAREIDEATMRAVHEPLIATTQVPGILLPIGLLVLATALWKTRVMPRPMVLLFALGTLLFPVGRIILGPSVSVVSDLLLLVALGDLGRRVLGSPTFWNPALKSMM
ncbi:MAG TPA: hypothetical protein VM778_09870 [Gemmatimonadota bacterium]|nr:hypothetical protein [Gemmatimonadota bacterium]